MNNLELKVKYGVFKESKILEDEKLQVELDEKIKFIFDYLDMLYKDKDVSSITVDINSYIELVSNMSSYFLSSPVHDDLCQYFNFITEVIFNWSRNSIKSSQLETFSLMLNRLIECRNRFKESTDIIKDSFERYIELANWQPPVFDLSIEYFEKLLEQNEKLTR